MNFLLPIVFVILMLFLFFYYMFLLNLKPKYTNKQILNYLLDKIKKKPIIVNIKKTIGLNLAVNKIIDVLIDNNKQIFKDILPEEMESSFNPSKLRIYPSVFTNNHNHNHNNYVPDNFFDEYNRKEAYMFLVYNDTGNVIDGGGGYFNIIFNIL